MREYIRAGKNLLDHNRIINNLRIHQRLVKRFKLKSMI